MRPESVSLDRVHIVIRLRNERFETTHKTKG